MSRKANRLGQFEDIKTILDAALATNGGEVELPTHGEAVHWRHRAYRFRKLYAETISHMSPYDALTFPRLAPDSRTVVIKLGAQKAIFTPKDISGKKAETVIVDENDELLAHAINLAKDL